MLGWAGASATPSGAATGNTLPTLPTAAATSAASAAGIATVAADPTLVRPMLLPLRNASARCGETASSVQNSTARLPE